ncbi:MAG: helix-turn-helix domain-containing protein [Oscillospiraceae bacterium]|nr:helix-turn-helix domain-containing protein [Oscillospiraceae bacterium]
MFWFRRINFVCASTDVADICFQTVFSADFMQHAPPTLAPVHSHLNCELFFVNQGQCTFRCGDRDYTCNPSDILVINAGTQHNRLQISPDALLYSLQFSFSPNRKQTRSFYDRLFSTLSSPVLLQGQETLLSTLNLLRQEFALQQPLYDTTIDALLQVFYTQLLRSLLELPAPSLPQQFPIVPTATEEHRLLDNVPQVFYTAILDSFFLSLPLHKANLTELSKTLSLSAAQTRRVVKRYYGVSFQERLIQAKLQRSQFLMDTTDLSLKAIAERVGYGSYHAFFKAFTAHTGQTPSEYRQTRAKE